MTSSTADIRVRYAHIATDHVYYANYFRFFEASMTKLYREYGLPFLGRENEGVRTMIAESFAKYVGPARYDELLQVTSTIEEAAPKRLMLAHTLRRGEQVLCEGRTAHVLFYAGRELEGVQRFPDEVLKLAQRQVERVELAEKADVQKQPPNFVHEFEIPVRYGETDAAGIVYFSNYYAYFEAAQTELFRAGDALGNLKSDVVRLPVSKAYCTYLAPIRFGDVLRVRVGIADVTRVRLMLRYDLCRSSDGAPVASGFTLHGCLNADGKPVPVPDYVTRLA